MHTFHGIMTKNHLLKKYIHKQAFFLVNALNTSQLITWQAARLIDTPCC